MTCPICDDTTETFIDERSNITYYHCNTCEYIFKSPECHQSIAEQKSRYDLHENHEDHPGYKAYFERFLDFVLPLAGAPETALDFGCGRSSLLAKLLAERGIDCDYYDPLYYPENLDDSKKYELIVSTEVFEHLPDPKAVFGELVKRVESKGYLAIQTQFHPNDIEVFKKWYYHQDPTHIVFFRSQTFRVLSEKYGCEFVEDNGKNMVVIRKR